jgi:hypothetical protein
MDASAAYGKVLRNLFLLTSMIMRRIFGFWQGAELVRSSATGQFCNAARGQKDKHNVGCY